MHVLKEDKVAPRHGPGTLIGDREHADGPEAEIEVLIAYAKGRHGAQKAMVYNDTVWAQIRAPAPHYVGNDSKAMPERLGPELVFALSVR